MADTFQLEVATPERLLVDAQVTEAELPGKDGYMGVLPGHAPLLSVLGTGTLTYSEGGAKKVLNIEGGGFVKRNRSQAKEHSIQQSRANVPLSRLSGG
jgi:F0F1-type ATP synthase epsilon subunit